MGCPRALHSSCTCPRVGILSLHLFYMHNGRTLSHASKVSEVFGKRVLKMYIRLTKPRPCAYDLRRAFQPR